MSKARVPKGDVDKYRTEELQAALNNVLKRSKYKRLSLPIYDDERPEYYPSPKTITSHFGNWNVALKSANMETTSGRPIENDE